MQKGILFMLALWTSIASLAIQGQRFGPGSNRHLRCNPTLKLRQSTEIVYPEEAQHLGIHGTVVIELFIDKHGMPQHIHVVKGDSVLADAVVYAVKRWQWQPYRVNREPVEIDMMIAVNFEPSRTEAVPLSAPLILQR